MSRIVDVFVPLALASVEPLEHVAARKLGIPSADVQGVRVLRRSLDARQARTLGHRLRVEVFLVGESPPASPRMPAPARWPALRPRPRVVIVGSGPAGTWAALRLAEAGVPSTILERGKPVQPRRRDLAKAQRGQLDPDSNYCFGEGGAGTYSDGKLYTRTKDRSAVEHVLADLVRFGATTDITVDARPHVGSNRLPEVVWALRAFLEDHGVVYRFSSVLAEVVARAGRVCAVRTLGGEEIAADAVVLACGHSARDVYRWAARAGLALERKGSAVGVRMEHPQWVIDRMQYGRAAGDPRLPPAFYEVHANVGERSVYSFCMCPGGFVVPAATEVDGVVTNGMSLSRRNSAYANAAMVVAVGPADYGEAALGPLAGIEFQRRIEEAAFALGGGGLRAPAQRLADFLAQKPSTSLPEVSYHPGASAGRVDACFPPFVAAALRRGLAAITRRIPALLHAEAVLLAAETRTSAPVRIVRDAATLQSPSLAALYPAGEGAGYAGGIVSSAIDGARVAEAILAEARV
ncbi:MAG: FAD-dependent monooxygenase [Deltaproteobacteria bacterium]|nr:FAD-dependent monooxygenase [Deltaproteobacteria bacterium]